jgi:uncharacterized protein YbaR (Trm112 family)
MPDNLLHEVACPNCRSPIDLAEHGQQIQCAACSSRFILQGHLCPRCSTYHSKEVPFCGHCGTPLTRTCAKCGTGNWAGEEYCQQCGEAMDIFDLLSRHAAQDRQRWQDERRETIRHIKAIEEKSSQQRMAEFQAIEAERQAALRQRKAAQHKRDQLLLSLAVALLVVLAAAILITTFGG